MNHKKVLILIFVLAFLFRLVSALIIPVFEKPDEGPHFEYIEFLVENKKLPVQQSQRGEFFQPPFYHIFASFVLGLAKLFTDDAIYLVLFLRFLSIIVSMFTLYLIYKIASLLFANKNFILGIVAFAAFLPSHVNINSAITNANFADLLTTLIIYLLLKTIMVKEDKKIIFSLGLIAGIALITRFSLIPIILTIPFAFIVKYYPKINPNLKKILKSIILIAIISLLVSFWNFIRNFALYGDFLGINAMLIAYPPDDITINLLFIARLLGWTFITFGAAFGRTNGIFIGNLESTAGIFIFIIFYLLLLLITLASLYGLYSFIRKCGQNKSILNNIQKKYFIIAFFHFALLTLSFISFNLYDFQPQGRLFFPAISTIAILFTLGIYSSFSQKSWKKLLNFYLIILILINIISFTSIINHYLKIY